MASAESANAVFERIDELLKRDPEVAKKAPAVFQFVIVKDGASAHWVVDCKAGSVREEKADKPDCTLTLSETDFIALTSGKLGAQKAFMVGKLKIGGNMATAQKFSVVTSKLSAPTSKL